MLFPASRVVVVVAIAALIVTASAASWCGVVEANTDFQGNDLTSVPAASAQECCPHCSANPSCTGFAYAWGTCYLKYGALVRISKAGVSAVATSTGVGSCTAIEANTDFQGNDLDTASANSAQECCPICSANPSCTGFSYGWGTCYLKYGPLVRVYKQGVSASVVKPSQCAQLQPNVDYSGNDIECTPSIVTPDACCAKCAANSQCKLFVVSKFGCCIKHTAANRQDNLDPSWNVVAAFRTSSSSPLTVVDASTSPDVRVNKIAFSFVAGAQWFPATQLESTSFLEAMNATISHHVHGSAPEQLTVSIQGGANTIMPFTSVTSVGECAALVAAHGESFFTYLPDNEICLGHQFLSSSAKTLLRQRATLLPTSPVVSVAKTIPVDFALSSSVNGADDRACMAACEASTPAATACAATTRSSTTCTLFGPLLSRSTTTVAGWLTSPFVATVKPNLPVFANPTKVHIYTTAHQDDHELFMANTYHYSIADASTKVVFVYTTAGDDKDALNSWRIARERGTLAASTAWVDNIGKFNSSPKTETVTMLNRKIAKVTVGNMVHYFLRVPEFGQDGQSGFMELMNNVRPVAPADDPSNPYPNRKAFQDVLTAIFNAETNGIKTIQFHAQDPQAEGPDHPMHYASGQLSSDIVNANAKWKTCAPQHYYYDYQRWLWDVNVDRPVVYDLQRYAWLRMSQAIYNTNSSVIFWSIHSENLGRTYIRRSINANAGPC
ncbi:hypothetical protein H310_12972 [Aphanomyces invadans]|uniref:Apple domain-containing protein n=1 Tax=Aphanomyces invadans TaxID=157072 RepID=A0A024TFF2_9STRA|nr:hypothetical protein H310_12972 [Aphanomyces invadans]ETV92739.1 hypothetical protein H310_12972 [Aphanomyces invadans]|eukprot:XP_008878509.1 hypothetical protein H310_12972 [Aphanomyces invadans]